MHYNYIAIEGNIGAGKTTLATRIAADIDARLILEQFEDNSFLPKFYIDPDRFAFPLELSFLADRFQQLKNHLGTPDLFQQLTISDYFIHKSLIFARKTLAIDEFTLYSKLFSIIDAALPKPDMLVYLYLEIEKLTENIRKRGRDYEQNIDKSYLERIQSGYFDYIKQQQDMRILIIDTNNMDFVENNEDYNLLLGIIGNAYETGVHRIKPK
ncbi:MAG: deoxynucleoside kinase [Bacteroidales bacterium]